MATADITINLSNPNLDYIEERISELKKQRHEFEITYGSFSQMVSRIDATIGSLRLLRDFIRSGTTIGLPAYEATTQSREFILYPFYWYRCTEINETMQKIMERNIIQK